MSRDVDFKNRDRLIELGLAITALRKLRGMSQERLAVSVNSAGHKKQVKK